MNEVIYQGHLGGSNQPYSFSDADGTLLEGATASMFFSPLGDELRAHECKIPVIYRPRDYSITPEDFMANARKGERIEILQDGGIEQLFFLTSISGGKKIAPGEYRFELIGTDYFGLLANTPSYGGIYPVGGGGTYGAMLRDAIGSAVIPPLTDPGLHLRVIICRGDIPMVAVDESIYNQAASGYLPATNDVRENLRYIMQAAGAYSSIVTLGGLFSGATVPYITTRYKGEAVAIPDEDVYAGDDYVPGEVMTEVAVNEYSYLQAGGTVKTLFETTGSTNEVAIFDEPCYNLTATGLTISKSGANYAIVSGAGKLEGTPYTITTRQLTQSTGLSGSTATRTLDNPLVGSLNSAAMLQRMVNYYSSAKVIKNAIKAPGGMRPGDLLRMSDPAGEVKQGYAQAVDLTFSGIDKADEELVVDWQPISGDVFTQRQIFDASGTLTVPDGATLMRLILIQGGKGGWGGYRGENAHSSGFGQPPTVDGEGGSPGEGGDPGKVTVVDVEQADLAASYTITVGTAGTPGGINHGEGTEGTHSSAVGGGNTYSSSTGAVPDYGVADPMTGVRYAVRGPVGVYAGRPGGGPSLTDTPTGVTGNTTWYAGNATSAGNGGGAAYGANGGNAGRASGSGGDGADAVLDGINGYTAPVGTYGSGGIGGNGGGGGGGHVNNAGAGGSGSAGGPAAGGAVIALFAFGDTPAPVPTPNWLFDADGEPLYDYYYERLAAQEE